MKLVICAHTFKNEPLMPPIVGEFGTRGGTIGRMATNDLVLPDPDRLISRVQAELRSRDGGFTIRNVGSVNPILHNGRPVIPGECVILVSGDEIVIGTYGMRASLEQYAADPSLDRTVIDERGLIRQLAGRKASSRKASLRAAEAAAMNPDIDDASQATIFPDLLDTPVPTGPLDSPDVPPLPPKRNPFEGFILLPEAPRRPHVAEDASGLDPAPGIAASASQAPAAAPANLKTAASPVPDMPLPEPRLPPPAHQHKAFKAKPVLPPIPMPPVKPLPPPASPIMHGPVDEASAKVLWKAFCEGADIDMQVPQGLNPDLMRVIGQLMRHAVDGTLKLVASRTAAKRKLRARMTTLQRRNNNPLKFSADARVAIDRLLQPPTRDFMAGPAAVNEVMDDLLGHANGSVAGMHAALAGVLQQFEPAQLEAQLSSSGMLDTLLPMHRSAKLWDLYLKHFKRIQSNAEDNFHELFGKEFMRAYSEEVARLAASRTKD